MRKVSLLLSLLLAAFISSMAQESVTLTFTANTQNGLYCPFDAVNVSNVTRGWTETLAYPDTVLVMNSIDGINEQNGMACHLGEAYPNPFTDETQMSLEMSEAGDVLIQVVRVDGTIVATHRNRLEAGLHSVRVRLSNPSMALLAVTTAQGRQVLRLISAGNGSCDAVTVETLSAGFKPDNQSMRSDATGEFQPGDMMRYTAVLFDGANTIYSNTITQQQYDSQDMTLYFDLTPPIGAINSLFSVSETQQVYISQGNLQYQASTDTWRFATNQWDYIGENNSNISETNNGWIDLYGWGTSGYNHGAFHYQPWSIERDYWGYFAYGDSIYNLSDQTGKADWGYNSISNGGEVNNNWRTLNSEEWQYVFNMRLTDSGIRFAGAKIDNIKGVVLLPDNWDPSLYTLNGINDCIYDSNIIMEEEWIAVFEPNGAIFLPSAGCRMFNSVYQDGNTGYYWSASSYNAMGIRCLSISNYVLDADNHMDRSDGLSVRLVHNLK